MRDKWSALGDICRARDASNVTRIKCLIVVIRNAVKVILAVMSIIIKVGTNGIVMRERLRCRMKMRHREVMGGTEADSEPRLLPCIKTSRETRVLLTCGNQVWFKLVKF